VRQLLLFILFCGVICSKDYAASTHKVKIALCQILVIDGDREGNFRRIDYALQTAAAQHADIATFPESSILGWENPEAHHLAAPIPGDDSERIAAMARKYGLMIAIGLDEKDGSNLYDSVILLDKHGTLLWKYRKLSVLPELMSPPYTEGDPKGIGVVDTGFGRIGLLICADTFVDEYAQRIAELKPDLVIIPYGWAAVSTDWPKHERNLANLVAGRAKQWGVPAVGTDLVGEITHGPWAGQTYGGASIVADNRGEIIARLRDRDVDVQVATIELSRTSHQRQ
jgi:predicted amidohydrolase